MSAELNDKVLNYATDTSFINWVRSGFKDNNEHWQAVRKDKGETGPINDAIEIVQSMEFDLPPVDEVRKQQLFSRIESELTETGQKKAPGIRKLWLPVGIAASLALMVALFWPGTSALDNYSTEMAETEILELPDQSRITMNASSSIRYNPKTFKASRRIQLEGEAFFQVEKGTEFIVMTPDVSVEVLGTSFNVFSRNGYAEVYCETGKVRVTGNRQSEELILTPGESAVYTSGKLAKLENTLSQDWRSGSFRYREAQLGKVLEELERQFDLKLEASPEIRNLKYTGFFERDSLEKALESVLWPLSLDYRKLSARQYIIEKN